MKDQEFQEQMEEIETLSRRFAKVFGADVIDTALAAVDEAMFVEGKTDPLYRGRLKRACLRKVGQAFLERAAAETV